MIPLPLCRAVVFGRCQFFLATIVLFPAGHNSSLLIADLIMINEVGHSVYYGRVRGTLAVQAGVECSLWLFLLGSGGNHISR